MSEVLLTTTDVVPGREIAEVFGLVDGTSAFVPGWEMGIQGALSTVSSGSFEAWSGVMSRARALARKELIERASGIGADAVVGMRYDVSAIGESILEVLVYGTAVKLTHRRA